MLRCLQSARGREHNTRIPHFLPLWAAGKDESVAIAKCSVCAATATVIFANGECSTTFGECFHSRCNNRGNDNPVEQPKDCPTMHSAVLRAQKRAEVAAAKRARLAL